jgi:phosphodiesterase/alkaline phosphatase D-like protein
MNSKKLPLITKSVASFVLLLALMPAAMFQKLDALQPRVPALSSTVLYLPHTKVDQTSNLQLYQSDKFQLTFQYPATWEIEEREFPPDTPPDVAKHQIILKGTQGEDVTITIFSKPENLEDWLGVVHPRAVEEGWLDFSRSEGMVSGKAAYMWWTPESGHDVAGVTLIFEGEEYLYQVGFPAPGPGLEAIDNLIKSLSTASSGPTALPFDIKSLSTGQGEFTVLVQGCCGETDPSANTYPCCEPTGNCTWKSEEMRPGGDNFRFSGPGTGRDAYRWMSLARQYTSYAQGGNIPVVGAVLVLVAIDGLGGLGHVATVSSINSDGSVTVIEQNCGSTCTRTQTYSTTWLRTYIAGYIYNGSLHPSPTPKAIGGGETIVDDFNWSNVYHFLAKGPGSFMSWNRNERAWGTSGTGAYNGWMHFIKTRASSSESENSGRWDVNIQAAGYYEIQAYIPNNTYATATGARYRVDGTYSKEVNQNANRGLWVKISNPGRSDGYWYLSSGVKSIELADTDGGGVDQWLAFDALKFISRSTGGGPPTATTNAASNVTSNSATLNGTVNPNGLATTVYFQWGTSTSYGNTTPSQSIGSGTSNVNVSANLSGLSPNTTYHYRVVAYNSAGTRYGSNVSFTTTSTGGPPTATTNAASNVTSNSATLNGTVNPNGLATTVYFQWGTSTSYGNTTPSQSIGSGTSNVNVSANLSGLSPNTTYHYRVVAYNSAGTRYGSNVSFTTTSTGGPPTATTNAASNVTSNSATLNGTVNPNGLATTVYFQWGTSTSYGNTTPSQSIGSGTSNVNVSANLSGLSPNTTYHYRVVAYNSAGTRYGSNVSFTTTSTGGPPTATTNAASNVTSNSATLNGTVNPNGLATTVYFQWGTSTSYGNTTPSQSIGSGTSNVNVSANLSGLSPNTTYHYRVVAYNSAGTRYGSNVSFTTTSTGGPPTATTNAASNVTSNSATLNGTVNPNGLATTVYFQWGTSTSYGNTTPSQSIGSGTSNVNVSANLSGLSPNTTYHYRVVAYNSAGTRYGSNVSFTTTSTGGPPTATTNAASNVTSNSATLNGTVNPNGLATTVYFQWGTSTSYGNTTPSQSIGSGTSNVNVSANLSGLSPNTTYHYRVVAYNSAGTRYGSNVSFTTTSTGGPPTATTNAASNVTSNSATLNGTVNPNGLATTVYFQWGTSTSYGNTTPSQSIGSGTSNVNVSANLSGLSPNTTYHYRVVAYNSAGTRYGSNVSFTTTGSTCTTSSQLLANPGFENGNGVGWITTSGVIDNRPSPYPARTGSWKAWLNGYGTTHTDYAYQQITIPSNACSATLTFWLWIDSAETTTTTVYDTLQVQILDSSGNLLATLATYSNLNETSGYVQRSFNLIGYKGQTIRIRFYGTEDFVYQTSFLIDDVAVIVTQ